MILVEKLRNDTEVLETLLYFNLKYSNSIDDVITAFNLLSKYRFSDIDMKARIHNCALMCRHMEPDVEDAIAILLGYYVYKGNIKETELRNSYDYKKAQKYYYYIKNLCRAVKENDELEFKKRLNYHIMHNVCDKMVDSMTRDLQKDRVSDIYCINDAYKLASDAHYWYCRKSGEPYITHPVMVAKILADVRVESPIIAAALLHDVLEDSDYTYNDIERRCSKQIAQYVDAVTSLHKRYEEAHMFKKTEQLTETVIESVNLSNDSGADDESDVSDEVAVVPSDSPEQEERVYYGKLELDRLSFEKLVNSVSSEDRMIFALYIKAADRIHNLRTIDIMSSEKKHNKTDETELDYLPLFRKFHLQYYVDIIDDLTWRTNNLNQYNDLEQSYARMHRKYRQDIEEMSIFLDKVFSEPFKRYCGLFLTDNAFEVTIKERQYRPYEIYKMLKQSSEGMIDGQMVNKTNIFLCDYDIILDSQKPNIGIEDFIGLFTRLYVEEMTTKDKTITDCSRDADGKFIVCFEDVYNNKFRCIFWLRDQYLKYIAGGKKGMFLEEDDSSDEDEGETIRVFLKNGAQKEIVKGATVLDLAATIHEELFLSAKGATINEQPAKIYNILHDGDRVIIDADTSRNSNGYRFVRHARIDWLFHVKTNKAQKKLKEFLEDKYEGDNPMYEESQPDPKVRAAAKEIINRFFIPQETK